MPSKAIILLEQVNAKLDQIISQNPCPTGRMTTLELMDYLQVPAGDPKQRLCNFRVRCRKLKLTPITGSGYNAAWSYAKVLAATR
jgi:hypothetical protein